MLPCRFKLHFSQVRRLTAGWRRRPWPRPFRRGRQVAAAAKERHRPMPDRLTVWVWGSSKELLLTASVAVRASTAVGMKVILIVQLDSAASEAPQLSASAKSPASVPVTLIL